MQTRTSLFLLFGLALVGGSLGNYCCCGAGGGVEPSETSCKKAGKDEKVEHSCSADFCGDGWSDSSTNQHCLGAVDTEGFRTAIVPGTSSTAVTGQECSYCHERCSFAGVSSVHKADGESVIISSLRPGDVLLSPSSNDRNTYITDAHALDAGHETDQIIFNAIYHRMMKPGKPLLITGSHLMFSRTKDAVSWALTRADEVKVGDYVQALKHENDNAAESPFGPSQVTHIEQVRAPGFFAPITTSGRLVVDGVAVSSYAITGEAQQKLLDAWPWAQANVEFILHTFFLPTRWWYSAGLPMEWLHSSTVAQAAFTILDQVSSSATSSIGFLGQFGNIFQHHSKNAQVSESLDE